MIDDPQLLHPIDHRPRFLTRFDIERRRALRVAGRRRQAASIEHQVGGQRRSFNGRQSPRRRAERCSPRLEGYRNGEARAAGGGEDDEEAGGATLSWSHPGNLQDDGRPPRRSCCRVCEGSRFHRRTAFIPGVARRTQPGARLPPDAVRLALRPASPSPL
jgi:hypothetical protein